MHMAWHGHFEGFDQDMFGKIMKNIKNIVILPYFTVNIEHDVVFSST